METKNERSFAAVCEALRAYTATNKQEYADDETAATSLIVELLHFLASFDVDVSEAMHFAYSVYEEETKELTASEA